MLSNARYQQNRPLFQVPKIPSMFKQSTSGTLSPDTTTTTSSGYSTGGSSISTTLKTSLKKSSSSSSAPKQHQQPQYKTKPKGLYYLLTKLKNLLLPSKTKHIHSKTMRSTTSRQISSTNIIRQYYPYSTMYDVLPSSSLPTNNTISLPFTYYYNSPIRQSRTNFDKISAWLNHTEKMAKNNHDNNDLLFIDTSGQHTTESSSSTEIDNQAITVAMKKTSTNIKPPKRSSSLVTRITRPIIEQQSQRTISPTSSFSSSILTKGMSERITPPSLTLTPQKTDKHSPIKSNRRRTIDFPRRRTVASTIEHNSNKENFSIKNQEKSSQDIYQFSPLSSNNKVEVYVPSSKHIVTKKYYFHSNPTKTNEDLLNNSYGLTLLKQQQQQQQEPIRQRHSVATVLTISQIPNYISSKKELSPQISSIQQQNTLDSLDDLLCDREVESYFYPISSQSETLYMNLENPSDLSYQSYIHGTLC